MLKDLIRRYIPSREQLGKYRVLNIFGSWLHRSSLWALTRHTLARGAAIGLFCAFLPIPFQMVVAASFALIWRANLPLSVGLVWITNPLTMAPIFYFTYKLGAWILQIPPSSVHQQHSVQWLFDHLHLLWRPLLLGSVICGILTAIIGYITVHVLLKQQAWQRWKMRRNNR